MDLDLLKTQLNIGDEDDTYDQYLTNLIDSCIAFFQQETGQILEYIPNYRVTVRNVSGLTRYRLKVAPVNSIVSITADEEVIDETTYELDDLYIYFDNPVTASRLVLVLDIGYKDDNINIQTVIFQMVEFLFKQATKANYLNQPDAIATKPVDMLYPAYIMDNIAVYRI
jgi:hypothetical protein